MLYDNSPEVAATAFGRYSLTLTATFPYQQGLELEQKGTIPSDAIGLSVFIASIGGDGIVSINGQDYFGTSSERLIDISALAGQTADIRITIPGFTEAQVDILGFTYVPEPSTLELVAIGGVGLGLASWKRQSLFQGRKMRQDRPAKVAE